MVALRFLLLSLCAAASLTITAQPATLVKDVGAGGASTVCSGVSQLTNIEGRLFFRGCNSTDGDQPWISDGTSAGTHLLRAGASGPSRFTDALGTAYFVAFDLFGRMGLWKSDGTAAGTVPVLAGSPAVPSGSLAPLGSSVVFGAGDQGVTGLWKSDGTAAGTLLLSTIEPVSNFVAAGGTLVFVGSDGTRTQLWKTDGTSSGTSLLKDIAPGSAFSSSPGFTSSGLEVFFFASDPNGRQLWKTDGTDPGTVRLTSIDLGGCFNTGTEIASAAGTVFFACSQDLWKTDGTPGGAQLVATGVVQDRQLTALGGSVLFQGCDPAHGCEPWKSDGTAQGTGIIRDIVSGPFSFSFSLSSRRLVGSEVFFVTLSGLWKTDGTETGTVPVYEPPNGLGVGELEAVGSTLFFAGNGELWKSDGTSAGTTSLASFFSSGVGAFFKGSSPSIFSTLNGRLFFEGPTQAPFGFGAPLIWTSDGTDAGTSIVQSNWFENPLALNGQILFATPGTSGASLWTTDGSDAGTVPVTTFAQEPSNLTEAGGLAYFVADDGTHGRELWRSDGTLGGTFQLKDILPGSSGSGIAVPTAVENHLVFGASDGVASGLWRSDGTSSGTSLVKNVGPVTKIVHGDGPEFFFTACPAQSTPCVVGSSDGTPSGTVTLVAAERNAAPLYALGLLFFVGFDAASGFELWKTDGTPGGTTLVKDILPGPDSSAITGLTAAFGKVFFSADDGVHGAELWVSDGTFAGTRLFKDLAPGLDSSAPQNFFLAPGTLLFTAATADAGFELWSSDGTVDGTAILQDIAPGPSSSTPATFFIAGDNVFFTANDGTHGVQLWALPLMALPASGSLFHPLTPCRAVDTRIADGGLGGAPLASGTMRTFGLSGRCGVPATARSLAANVTSVSATGSGFLSVFSASRARPDANVLSFGSGQTRASQAILELRGSALTSVFCSTPPDTGVHLVIDVVGYFE